METVGSTSDRPPNLGRRLAEHAAGLSRWTNSQGTMAPRPLRSSSRRRSEAMAREKALKRRPRERRAYANASGLKETPRRMTRREIGMAPRAGLEPTTWRLTAARSTN